MKNLICLLLIICGAAASLGQTATTARLVEHRRIWNSAPHNAFTDLIRFKGKWFCAFREGSAHVSQDGSIRVIWTDNGLWWEPAAQLKMSGLDLRDPKLSISPDGKELLVLAGAVTRDEKKVASLTQSIIARSADGWKWKGVNVVGAPNYWLWRMTWFQDTAYGVAYAVGPDVAASGDHHSMLFSSRDATEFEVFIPDFLSSRQPRPTEATLRFDAKGNMLCLHRRDGGPNPTALLGFSTPPYENWEWRDTGDYFGGPNFIQTPSGKWIAVGRRKDFGPGKKTRTVVCELDLQDIKLIPLLELPSDGDSSYPGLVWHEGMLWISYYSSHEGKTSIYLAKVQVD
jgi:hypothetical protein